MSGNEVVLTVLFLAALLAENCHKHFIRRWRGQKYCRMPACVRAEARAQGVLAYAEVLGC